MASGPSPYDREFVSRSVDLGYLTERDVLELYRQEVGAAETSTLMPLGEWLASTGRMTREEVARVRETLVEGAVEIPTPAPLVGSTLAGYRIVQEIGSGGMGKLYRGYDPTLEKFFAVKVLPADYATDPVLLERFRKEAKLASRIDDPHVVPILRFGEERGLHYCVMPLVEGTNLRGHIERRGGPLPLGEALAILSQAALGLAAIHRVGIVHRDVKPENILLDREDRVRVVDFGLARDVRVDSSLTASGQVLGTPYYMSPEQAVGQQVDVRSDVYSLGLTFYFLLAAEPPFQGSSPFVVLSKQTTEPVPDPGLRNPTARGPAIELLREMTAKDPEDRPRTMEDVVARIRSLPDAAAAVRSPERGRAAARGARRSPVRAGAFASAALGLLLVAGIVVWATRGSEKEVDDAPPAPEPVAGPVRPEDPPPAGGGSAEDAGRWLAEAEEFRSAHAGEADFVERVLSKYREVIRRHPDTLAASRSADRIAEILQEEARGLEARLAALVDTGLAERAFAEIEKARARFPDEAWPGMLATVTASLGKRLAAAQGEELAEIERLMATGRAEDLVEARRRLQVLGEPGCFDYDVAHSEALRASVKERLDRLTVLVSGAVAGELGPVFSALSLGDLDKAERSLRETLARFGEEDAEEAARELESLAGSLDLARRSMWHRILSGELSEARAEWEDRKKDLALRGVPYPIPPETAPIAAFESAVPRVAARLDEDCRAKRWIHFRLAGEAKPSKRFLIEVRQTDDLLATSIVFREYQDSDRVEKGLLDLEVQDLVLLSLGRALDEEPPAPPAQGQESYDAAVLLLCLGEADAAESLARAGVTGDDDRARILLWARLVREESARLASDDVGPSPVEDPEERQPPPTKKLSERVVEHFGRGARVLDANGDRVRIEAVYEFDGSSDLDYFVVEGLETYRAQVRDGSWWVDAAPAPGQQEAEGGRVTLRGEWAEEIEVEVVFRLARAGNYFVQIQYFQEYRSDQDSHSFDATLYCDHAEIREGPFVEFLGSDSRRPEPEELGSLPLGKELRCDVEYSFVAGAEGASQQVSLSSQGTKDLRIKRTSDGARTGSVTVSWDRVSGIRFDRIRVRGLLAPSTLQELMR